MLAPCPASIVNHIRALMGIPSDSIRREHALVGTVAIADQSGWEEHPTEPYASHTDAQRSAKLLWWPPITSRRTTRCLVQQA